MATVITAAALLLLLGYTIIIYNGLVGLKHSIQKAWSNIEVMLKQRHDELPKLVETCRQHMQFERSTLEQVMRARSTLESARERGDVKSVGAAETAVRAGFGSIVATAEAYPELRADESIRQLLSRITGLENAISDRREFYNEYVNANNIRIEQFPDVLVARIFGFKSASLLEFTAAELADVNMRELFAGGAAPAA